MSLKFFRTVSVDEQELINQFYLYPKDQSIILALHGIRQEKLGNYIAAAEQYTHSEHPIALQRLGWLQPLLSSRQDARPSFLPTHAHTHTHAYPHTHAPVYPHTHVLSHAPAYIPSPSSPVMNFHAPTTVNFNPVGQQTTHPSVILTAKQIEEDSAEKPVHRKRRRKDEAKYDYTLQMIDHCQDGFLKLDEILTIDKFAYFLGLSYSGTCNRLTNLREMGLLGPALTISENGRAHLNTLSPLKNPIEITREIIRNIPALGTSTSQKKQKVTVEPIKETDPYLSNPPKALVFSGTTARSTLRHETQQAATPAVQTSTSTPTPDKRMSLKFLTS